MTDTTTTNPQPPAKVGLGKVGSAIIAAIIARRALQYLQVQGIDFSTLGVSADLVKDSITGFIVGAPVWLTPSNFVLWVKDVILFFKNAWKQWRDAANSN